MPHAAVIGPAAVSQRMSIGGDTAGAAAGGGASGLAMRRAPSSAFSRPERV
jgi:hypothetical protein